MQNYTRFWHLEGGSWIDVALRYDNLPIQAGDRYIELGNILVSLMISELQTTISHNLSSLCLSLQITLVCHDHG